MRKKNISISIIISIIMIIAGHKAASQTAFVLGPDATVPKNDTVIIRLHDHVGDIQWQKSLELNGEDNWENIPGATADTLLFVADTTSYLRALVVAGHCDPFYSDTTHVNVYTLKDNVVIVEPDEQYLISTSAEIESGIYRFAGENDNIEIGSIIVGSQDEGFMRRVLSIEVQNDTMVLVTEQATMEDVFDDFYMQESIIITMDQSSTALPGWRSVPLEIEYLPPGARLRSSSGIDFSNTVIYSDNFITVGIEEGFIDFNPEIDIEFDFKNNLLGIPTGLNSFKLVASGEIDCDFKFYAESEQEIDESKSILLAKVTVPAPVGPVPVTVTLSFYLGFNANMEAQIYATAGYDSDYYVASGAEYNSNANPQWKDIWEREASFTPLEPTFSAQGELNAKVYLKPELTLNIAGIPGPSLYVDPYLRVKGEFDYPNPYWYWELGAGVGGYLAYKLSLISRFLEDYNKQLLNWDVILAQGSSEVDADLPTLTTSPVSDITTISATGGGNITSDGGAFVTARGVVWSTNPNPSLTNNDGETYDGDDFGEFISDLTGLTPNTQYYVRAYATNNEGTSYGNELIFTTEASAGGCGSVTFTYNGSTVTYGTVISADGRCWLDRNLGATQVATSSTDEDAYGDLFQWGRLDDGHQVRTSPTTTTLSNSDVPGHGNFILAPGNNPFDWRSPQNDDLWKGEVGTNNPCPDGYRLPTQAEWDTERASWSTNNAAGAFASPLKLPVAGYRSYFGGSVFDEGYYGYYWSSTVNDIGAWYLYLDSGQASIYSYYRADGYSVRCLKD